MRARIRDTEISFDIEGTGAEPGAPIGHGAEFLFGVVAGTS
jgi:hypothetical protein